MRDKEDKADKETIPGKSLFRGSLCRGSTVLAKR